MAAPVRTESFSVPPPGVPAGIHPELHDQFLSLADRLNNAHREFCNSPQWESVLRFYETQDKSDLTPDIRKRLEGLEYGRKLVIEALSTEQSQAQLAAIADNYRGESIENNKISYDPQEMITIAARKFKATSGKTKVISDCDGTMTHQTHRNGDIIDALLAGSPIFDPLEHEQPENYLVFTAAIRDYFLKRHPDLLAEGAGIVALRERMPELYKELQDQDIDLLLLSANSVPFVQKIAERFGLSLENIGICAVSEDETHGAISFDKDLVIKMAAIANPEQTIIYFGDGGSDLKTLEASEQIAAYFALESSSFARELEEKRQKEISEKGYSTITYFTYKTGDDIKYWLDQIRQEYDNPMSVPVSLRRQTSAVV